ncbi:hypothetical protein [Sulfurimonas sp. NW9]|uniref:hypothetical protein n=1 Tax=Sulfurimonas sp. NW9 TaxID=2922728 RepID=UPI003DA7ABD6
MKKKELRRIALDEIIFLIKEAKRQKVDKRGYNVGRLSGMNTILYLNETITERESQKLHNIVRKLILGEK